MGEMNIGVNKAIWDEDERKILEKVASTRRMYRAVNFATAFTAVVAVLYVEAKGGKDDTASDAGSYVCAILTVNEGSSDIIGWVLLIPGLPGMSKALLQILIFVSGAYVLAPQYIEGDDLARVTGMIIPVVAIACVCTAIIVTWPREKPERWAKNFGRFNQYFAEKDGNQQSEGKKGDGEQSNEATQKSEGKKGDGEQSNEATQKSDPSPA